MHRARRGNQPRVPNTTREWGAMIISEEWRQRYENTIGNRKYYILSIRQDRCLTLFSIIICTCYPSKPIDLWIKYKDHMCDDILYQIRNRMGNLNIQINKDNFNNLKVPGAIKCLWY